MKEINKERKHRIFFCFLNQSLKRSNFIKIKHCDNILIYSHLLDLIYEVITKFDIWIRQSETETARLTFSISLR